MLMTVARLSSTAIPNMEPLRLTLQVCGALGRARQYWTSEPSGAVMSSLFEVKVASEVPDLLAWMREEVVDTESVISKTASNEG